MLRRKNKCNVQAIAAQMKKNNGLLYRLEANTFKSFNKNKKLRINIYLQQCKIKISIAQISYSKSLF